MRAGQTNAGWHRQMQVGRADKCKRGTEVRQTNAGWGTHLSVHPARQMRDAQTNETGVGTNALGTDKCG